MRGSLKGVMSTGVRCSEKENAVCEMKDDTFLKRFIVVVSLLLLLFVFSRLPFLGLHRQIYSHPLSCVTAIYLSSSANGYLLRRFLDDSQDGALSSERSLCLIWVSGLGSPEGTQRGTKQIAFKTFNKSEYTFLTV